jgi:hypothetical protein
MKSGMATALLWLGSLSCLFAAGTGETQSLTVSVRTLDGSTMVGVPEVASVGIDTAFGAVSVPLAILTEIQHEPGKTNTVLRFKNEDRVTGIWQEKTFAMKTAFGSQQMPLTLVKSIAVRSAAPKADALLHYTFDVDEGSLVRDSSGKENNGTVIGAKYTSAGKVGGAYQVGRNLGHLQVANPETWAFGQRPFSICFWLQMSSPPGGEQMLIAQDEGGGERNKWAFELLNGNVDFHINNPGSASYRIASHPWVPEVGKWYHLAMTRNGSAYSLYVDGVCVSTDQNTLPLPTANAPLTIGQGEGLYVEGTIDDVMIFDRALSQEDVREIHGAAN